MTDDENSPRVVWVLGAGFSQPLGGPLLANLLSLESREDLGHRHSLGNKDPGVFWLYHYGRKFKDGWPAANQPRGENLWDHAEDFLDKLDAAVATKGELAQRLNRVLAMQPAPTELGLSDHVDNFQRLEAVAARARNYVAAECCQFMRRSDPDSEQWEPHTGWLAGLGRTETVITFNYDRVLEVLNHEIAKALGQGPCSIVRSQRDWNKVGTKVLKLHGSVDWCWSDESNEIEVRKEDFAEHQYDPSDCIVMATPGPTKKRTVGDRLAFHWDKACSAISEADCIVFIGYRFPPTDAVARERLLDAIRRNRRPHVDLHVVLGSERNKDVVRLEHLLRTVVVQSRRVQPHGANRYASSCITVHPLFSQDFFSVIRRNDLIYRGMGKGAGAPHGGWRE